MRKEGGAVDFKQLFHYFLWAAQFGRDFHRGAVAVHWFTKFEEVANFIEGGEIGQTGAARFGRFITRHAM